MTVPFPLVFDEPDNVRARLADLGLSIDVVQECITDGVISRAACTEHDPPSFPGTTMWAVITRSLRMRLAPEGWEGSDDENYSIIVNPSRTVAIVVATGDEATGVRGLTPHTKYPKGTATQEAVTSNRSQLDLFMEAAPVTPIETARVAPLMFILLVRVADGVTHAELSLPLNMSKGGRIESWRERILLPMVGGDDDGGGVRRKRPEATPDIDVAVIRRVA